MEIVEFLLARIAEDEREWGSGAFAPVAGVGLSRLILKTRAECEAKRRIVERESGSWTMRNDLPPELTPIETSQRRDREVVEVHFGDGTDELMSSQTFRERFMRPSESEVMRLLALPYADHPDYREEWTP